MAIEVIGAGWGRTGTLSTRIALERLGFRCHHMHEVFANIDQAELVLEAADDPTFDWERLYSDYTATVDWPGCAFWRELMAAYPNAKVLLNIRDPESWYDSYHETIYEPIAHGWDDDETGTWNPMVQRVIVQRSFGGKPHDRDHLIAALRRHVSEVQATVPADRLLTFRVEDGWAPLCEFLDRPVPEEPFPHEYPAQVIEATPHLVCSTNHPNTAVAAATTHQDASLCRRPQKSAAAWIQHRKAGNCVYLRVLLRQTADPCPHDPSRPH